MKKGKGILWLREIEVKIQSGKVIRVYVPNRGFEVGDQIYGEYYPTTKFGIANKLDSDLIKILEEMH